MSDRLRRGYEIGQSHTLVGGRPFPVNPNVARSILHRRYAERCNDVSITDIAEPSPSAGRRFTVGCEALTFSKGCHEQIVRGTLHGILTPAVLRALGGDRQLVVEGGMVTLDAFEQSPQIRFDADENSARERCETAV